MSTLFWKIFFLFSSFAFSPLSSPDSRRVIRDFKASLLFPNPTWENTVFADAIPFSIIFYQLSCCSPIPHNRLSNKYSDKMEKSAISLDKSPKRGILIIIKLVLTNFIPD